MWTMQRMLASPSIRIKKKKKNKPKSIGNGCEMKETMIENLHLMKQNYNKLKKKIHGI